MAHYRDSISDYQSFQLGDFELQCGKKPNAQIAYKTLGSLNADKGNVIILNHPVGGTHENAEAIHLDGENRAISPEKHFIIMPNMFGNGLSSSIEHFCALAGPSFPSVTIFDSARAQYELVTETLGYQNFSWLLDFLWVDFKHTIGQQCTQLWFRISFQSAVPQNVLHTIG